MSKTEKYIIDMCMTRDIKGKLHKRVMKWIWVVTLLGEDHGERFFINLEQVLEKIQVIHR
jgi:hypothetical protein